MSVEVREQLSGVFFPSTVGCRDPHSGSRVSGLWGSHLLPLRLPGHSQALSSSTESLIKRLSLGLNCLSGSFPSVFSTLTPSVLRLSQHYLQSLIRGDKSIQLFPAPSGAASCRPAPCCLSFLTPYLLSSPSFP